MRVLACGVCRTDLHVVDGELPEPKLPLVPGHQIVGEVVGVGARARSASRSATGSGSRGSAGPDGKCRYCRSGRENLCERADCSPATRATAATPS